MVSLCRFFLRGVQERILGKRRQKGRILKKMGVAEDSATPDLFISFVLPLSPAR